MCYCKELVDPLFNRSFRYVADAGAGGDIVVNRLVRKQGVVLEDESDSGSLNKSKEYQLPQAPGLSKKTVTFDIIYDIIHKYKYI